MLQSLHEIYIIIRVGQKQIREFRRVTLRDACTGRDKCGQATTDRFMYAEAIGFVVRGCNQEIGRSQYIRDIASKSQEVDAVTNTRFGRTRFPNFAFHSLPNHYKSRVPSIALAKRFPRTEESRKSFATIPKSTDEHHDRGGFGPSKLSTKGDAVRGFYRSKPLGVYSEVNSNGLFGFDAKMFDHIMSRSF